MKPCIFCPKLEKRKKLTLKKIPYISGNKNSKKISYIFSKGSCSYILRNGDPEKIPYFSGNGNFLYLRKP